MSLAAFKDLPAGQPPPGVKANFEHPESKTAIFFAVGSILLVFMWASLVIRFYVRICINNKLVWGDATCLLAALLASTFFGGTCVGAARGPMGKHQWEVTVGDVTSEEFIIGVNFITSILVSPTRIVTQLTLFSLYYEIFSSFRWMRISIYIGAIVTTMFFAANVVVQIVLSTPKRGETWETHLFSKDNADRTKVTTPVAAVGLSSDLYLLILPLICVYDLAIPIQRRVALSVVFLMGILACIASALSIYFRYQITKTKDLTWVTQDVVLTTLVEMYVGVIVACMPAISKAFRYHRQKFRIWRSTRSSATINHRAENSSQRNDAELGGTAYQKRNNLFDDIRSPSVALKYHKIQKGLPISLELAHLKEVPNHNPRDGRTGSRDNG